jgi:hypothetical protein
MFFFRFLSPFLPSFLCCDVIRQKTLEEVNKWKEDIDLKVRLPNGKPIPVLLLANKVKSPHPSISHHHSSFIIIIIIIIIIIHHSSFIIHHSSFIIHHHHHHHHSSFVIFLSLSLSHQLIEFLFDMRLLFVRRLI